MEPPIPINDINNTDEKYYYKIGEVARKINIEPYVIRFWESEFPFLKPYKSKGSQRLYSKSDIEKILLIKDYLYIKKFTIEGAKKALRAKKYSGISEIANEGVNGGAGEAGLTCASLLKDIREELNSVKSLLSSRKTGKSK